MADPTESSHTAADVCPGCGRALSARDWHARFYQCPACKARSVFADRRGAGGPLVARAPDWRDRACGILRPYAIGVIVLIGLPVLLSTIGLPWTSLLLAHWWPVVVLV